MPVFFDKASFGVGPGWSAAATKGADGVYRGIPAIILDTATGVSGDFPLSRERPREALIAGAGPLPAFHHIRQAWEPPGDRLPALSGQVRTPQNLRCFRYDDDSALGMTPDDVPRHHGFDAPQNAQTPAGIWGEIGRPYIYRFPRRHALAGSTSKVATGPLPVAPGAMGGHQSRPFRLLSWDLSAPVQRLRHRAAPPISTCASRRRRRMYRSYNPHGHYHASALTRDEHRLPAWCCHACCALPLEGDPR